MKLNSKGFSISGILYPLFLIMLVFVTLILLVLINSKFALDKKKNEIVKDISGEGVVCAYTNWMTEEELTSEGKNVDDSDVQNRTEYAYQDIASWSDTYIETKPNDGYYKEKTQYRKENTSTTNQQQKYKSTTCGDGNTACVHGREHGNDVGANCRAYCVAGWDGQGYLYSGPGFVATQCGSACYLYRTVTVTSCNSQWTEWTDGTSTANSNSSGGKCGYETRTVYATPIWSDIDETKWNSESIYEATDTRRIVTRTTYRYFKCER